MSTTSTLALFFDDLRCGLVRFLEEDCYDPIQLHQHVLRPGLQNPRHSQPTPICSGTTPHTPLRTPLGLRSTVLRIPQTFVLTSPLPAPFVLLAIGRVPMTHKARFCCCFFVP